MKLTLEQLCLLQRILIEATVKREKEYKEAKKQYQETHPALDEWEVANNSYIRTLRRRYYAVTGLLEKLQSTEF